MEDIESKFKGLEDRFEKSGAREKISDLLINHLHNTPTDDGRVWVEKVKGDAHKMIRQHGVDKISEVDLYNMLKSSARMALSHEAKADVFEEIKKFVEKEVGIEI